MIIKFRRGFILVALVVIGAILLSLEGWRRLMRSEWLQQIAQQQLAAKFGDSLHYQQLEASLAGVRLRHVTYASPDHSLTVTIEEINVGFQLWDLLKNLIYHRHSEHVGATENVEVDSLSAHPLSGYRLDISINRPCLILLGSWNSRLQSWTQAQRQASSPASAPQLIQPCSSPDRTSSSSSAAVAPMADSATRPITPNATSRSWNLEFIRKLEVSDGQILFDPQDGNEPVLLADAIEGNLDPTVSAKHSATAPKSEAQWSGKLLAADQYNFFIRALIDMKSGRIDSVKVVLHEVVLQQLHNLWKLWDRLSRDTRSGTKVVLANDSTAQPVATREAFDKDWQIGSGVLNGRILLWPRPREHGKAVLAYAREQNPQHADAASVHASADRASISTWMSGFQASGELELRDGEVRFGEHVPVTMTVTNFHAELKDDTLKLRSNQQINQQLVQLSGGVRFSETRQPELDLIVTSDSMNTAEFLRPFLQAGENTNQQTQTGSTDSTLSRFPISGLAAFSGRISGSVRSPKLEAEIHSPQLKFYGQPVRNLAMQLAYTVQQHAGAADSSLKLVSGFGELDGLLCRGWGELYLWRPQRPLQLHLVAEGELTTHLKNLLPVDLPRCGATIEAQISGPLNDPRTTGQFTLRILGDQDFKKASPFPQPIERGSFLGNFSFYHDTLRIETNVEPSLQEVESRGMIVSARDHKSSDSPGLELSVEIWKHPSGGLTAGKMGSSSKPPLFRIRGQGIPLLSTVFGTAFPGSLFSNLEVDAYLEGRSDSINIRIDGRNHTAGGYTLFQLFGYFRTLGEAQRLVSGDLKIFPGAYNEIKATYSAVWQDSVFSITDVRAGDWLVGGLEIATRGTRALNGGVKIKRADISHLLEGVAREVHQYVGKLFAEFHVGGTIDTPCVEGDFWILDALFNGIGKFSISGKARLDGRGWEISTLEVRKNNQPFLQGAVSYQWATHTPHLELQAHDIEISEFLGAIAGVPPDIMTGRMSCELKTVDSWRGPDGGMRLPLTGFVRIQNGRIVWFMFDEISMHADAVRLAASTSAEIPDDKSFSYLGNNGIFFSRVGYEKSGAFTLAGSAYLPFNLKDFVNLSLSGDGNFLAILPDLTSFFQQTKSQGHLDLNLVGPYKNLTMRNSYLRFQDGFLKMSRVAPEAHDISGEAFVDDRGRFIQIFNLRGKVGDAILQVYNQESPPPFFAPSPSLANTGISIYQPLQLGHSQLHLGTILVKSSDNGLLLNIPGLMEPGEVGRFVVTGQNGRDEFLITGPWAHPLFNGRVVLEGVNFMFPFDEDAEPADSLIVKILLNSNWDVVVQSRKDNRYVPKTRTAIDNVYVNLGIDDERSELHFTGILQDSTFRTEGTAISTRGTVEYLDLNFRVEKFGAEFDKSDWWPIVYGRAWTTLTDSTNFPYNVYLTLHTIDPVTGEEIERGRFQNAYFKLSSDRPGILDNSQERILATLGYSIANVRSKATEAVGISTDNLVFRPLIRPVERQLERRLGLDVVRLSSRFTRNFLVANFNTNHNPVTTLDPTAPPETRRENPALAMLQSTRLLIGKYLWNDLYVNYIGQVEVGSDHTVASNLEAHPFIGLGLRHTLGLEYRINPAMHLQFEYDYNPLLMHNKEDRKIWLRHSFPVDFSGKSQ